MFLKNRFRNFCVILGGVEDDTTKEETREKKLSIALK